METATQPIVSEPTQQPQPFDGAAFLRANIPVEKGHSLKVTHVVGTFYRVNIFRNLIIGQNPRGDLSLTQGKIVWSRFVHCAVEDVGGKVGPIVIEAKRQ